MKSIILGLALLSSCLIFSQEKIEITKDGLTNTEQVIKLDSLTAKEIYSRLNKYIQKNYTNPDAVSKGNIENEFVSFNGMRKDCIINKIMFTDIYYSLNYYFNVDIKDHKIKLTLVQAKLIDTPSSGYTSHNINCFSYGSSSTFKSDGSPRSMYGAIISGFNKNINEIANDIVASIKQDPNKSDW